MRWSAGLAALGAVALMLLPTTSIAAEMRGVTSTEIRIGQTLPYSGPVSAFGALGKGEVGYFKMVNERGGINGRKVNLISLDESYASPKTVEQTRWLVESDEVALIFSSTGTAHNTAIAKYLQSKNIPQLFLASGASKFADIAQYPQATVGVQAPFRYEERLYARYALPKNPNAKFAVISQNDDFGHDYLAGLKDVFGDKYDSVVTGATYEISDPTIDSQIVKLKASVADVFVIAATPKFAAQSIRKVYSIKDLELCCCRESTSTRRRPITSRSTRCSSCVSTARRGTGSGSCRRGIEPGSPQQKARHRPGFHSNCRAPRR